MEIEFLKSIPEDQMEMMMQLHKLPELCGIYSDISDTSLMEFSHGSLHHQIMENSHVGNSSSTFFNVPSNISFTGSGGFNQGENGVLTSEQKRNSMAAMREMIFRLAAMQPINIDLESVKPPKRRNVKISKDPQSVAARHRRERISEKIRILQRLVPGGTKMDTASMLDEAIHYVKFLKNQVQSLEGAAVNRPDMVGIGFPVSMSSGSFMTMGTKGFNHAAQSAQHYTV